MEEKETTSLERNSGKSFLLNRANVRTEHLDVVRVDDDLTAADLGSSGRNE